LDIAPYDIFEMSKISVNRIYQKYSILDIFYHRNFHLDLYPQVSHFVTNGSIIIIIIIIYFAQTNKLIVKIQLHEQVQQGWGQLL